eukprot:TRINITY_DN79112_c0_g1_i1.p1 TRINITY_DN79112_c0_g1~~TRINITY_DN79112_c0_g1_i1.p1  ORF type:complete len:762 (-),score=138.25 TRINITY_DN79112_c0_g1_i1:37-2286(-)
MARSLVSPKHSKVDHEDQESEADSDEDSDATVLQVDQDPSEAQRMWNNFNWQDFQECLAAERRDKKARLEGETISFGTLERLISKQDLETLHVSNLKEFDLNGDERIDFCEFVDFLQELWAGRGLRFTREVGRLLLELDQSLQQGSDDINSVSENFSSGRWLSNGSERSLPSDVNKSATFTEGSHRIFRQVEEKWKDIDFEKLYRCFTSLKDFGCKGNEQKEFLKCLVARVPFMNDDEELVCRDLWLRRRMLDLDDVNILRSAEGLRGIRSELRQANSFGQMMRRRGLFQWLETTLWRNTKKKEYHFAITLSNFMDFSLRELSGLINAITDAGVGSGVYETLFVSALLTYAWHEVQPQFFLSLASQAVFILLLMWLAEDARNRLDPPIWVVLGLLVCALLEAIAHCLEVTAVIRNRRPTQRCISTATGYIFSSFWTCHEFLVTFYALLTISVGALVHHRIFTNTDIFQQHHSSWLHDHPVWVAALIGFKVNQMNVKLLATRAFGQMVIPAYRAIFDKASLTFVLFMILSYLTSVLSYYAIPVQLHDSEEGESPSDVYAENIFETLLSMFELDFGGNAELDTLEGNSERWVFNQSLVKASSAAALENRGAKPNKYWHHGVSVMYVFWFMWITLGLLNVFIGLLSNLYDEKLKDRRELFEDFRAVYTTKHLLRRQGADCLPCVSFCFQLMIRFTKKWRPETKGAYAWLAYDPTVFQDSDDTDVSKQLDKLRKQIKQLMRETPINPVSNLCR